MQPDEMLRMARRRSGLSQRAFSLQAGVGLRTLQQVEAGRTSVSVAWLSQALATAELELVPSELLPEPDPAVRAFLGLSLPMPLYRSVGGRGRRPQTDVRTPVWSQLRTLGRTSTVSLSGRAALCLWLPPAEPLTSLDVDVAPGPVPPTGPRVPTPLLRRRPPRGPAATVPVPLASLQEEVTVPTPADLALDEQCADERTSLLAVARLLDREAALDLAGRRVPAHRDPEHAREQERVFHDRRLHSFPVPPPEDVRTWRLGDDASLASWLLHHGIPG